MRGLVTLLEGPPVARELADIVDKFRTVSFDNVFRSQKLVNNKRRVSFHTTPPTTPKADYASAAAKVPAAPAPSSAAQRGSTAPSMPVPSEVFRNGLGQRVDPPLQYSNWDFQDLKGRKLCNSFHLLGKCYYKKCQRDHKEKLSPKQMVALRAVARQSHCLSGLSCSDPDCYYGHRCTRDNCDVSTCRFSSAMHGVDKNIVG